MSNALNRMYGLAVDARAASLRVLMPASVEVRLIGMTVFAAAMIYTILFAEMSPLHDATHTLRHSVLSVPCH